MTARLENLEISQNSTYVGLLTKTQGNAREKYCGSLLLPPSTFGINQCLLDSCDIVLHILRILLVIKTLNSRNRQECDNYWGNVGKFCSAWKLVINCIIAAKPRWTYQAFSVSPVVCWFHCVLTVVWCWWCWWMSSDQSSDGSRLKHHQLRFCIQHKK